MLNLVYLRVQNTIPHPAESLWPLCGASVLPVQHNNAALCSTWKAMGVRIYCPGNLIITFILSGLSSSHSKTKYIKCQNFSIASSLCWLILIITHFAKVSLNYSHGEENSRKKVLILLTQSEGYSFKSFHWIAFLCITQEKPAILNILNISVPTFKLQKVKAANLLTSEKIY